jgi:hypothetical protein
VEALLLLILTDMFAAAVVDVDDDVEFTFLLLFVMNSLIIASSNNAVLPLPVGDATTTDASLWYMALKQDDWIGLNRGKGKRCPNRASTCSLTERFIPLIILYIVYFVFFGWGGKQKKMKEKQIEISK